MVMSTGVRAKHYEERFRETAVRENGSYQNGKTDGSADEFWAFGISDSL